PHPRGRLGQRLRVPRLHLPLRLLRRPGDARRDRGNVQRAVSRRSKPHLSGAAPKPSSSPEPPVRPFMSALLLSSALLALPAAAQETRAVETPNGVVELPADPQRIVVLNAVVAGSLYALGLDLFAVTEAWKDTTEDGYSAFWAETAREQRT